MTLETTGTEKGKVNKKDQEDESHDDDTDKNTDTTLEIEPGKPKPYQLKTYEIDSGRTGFRIVANNEAVWKSFKLTVKPTALDELGSSDTAYQRLATYFSLQHIKYEGKKIENISEPEKNKIVLDINDKDFEFRAEGYHPHHIIKVQLSDNIVDEKEK